MINNEIIDEIPEAKILSEYKTDFSFSFKESNIFSLLLFFCCFILFINLFGLIWGYHHTWIVAEKFIFNVYITLPVIIAGLFLHEIIYGFTLIIFANIKITNLKAGICWVNFTPYIHCKHPVLVTNYRISTFAPVLLTGIIPVIISIFFNSVYLLFFGIIFIVVSGTDLLSLWKIRKINGNYFASDHPERAGCQVFENPF